MARHNACPECGFANTAGARFCERCGTSLPWLRAWAIVVAGIVLLLAAGSLALLWSRTPQVAEAPAGAAGVPASPTAAQVSAATATTAPPVSATPTPALAPPATETPPAAEPVDLTGTSSPTPASTQTPRPFNSPPPAMTPTRLPTATPLPSPTPSPQPTPCAIAVYEPLQGAWQVQAGALGCPTAAGRGDVAVSVEDFERGRALWRSTNRQIYILYSSGRWQQFEDTWFEGQPVFSCGVEQSPPTPLRGFGKVWCNHDEVRQQLGAATTAEWADSALVQEFVGGLVIAVAGDTYVLTDDGVWR